jgi:hypothetical protein
LTKKLAVGQETFTKTLLSQSTLFIIKGVAFEKEEALDSNS